MTHSSILEFHANGEILKFFSVFYGNCLVLLTDLKDSFRIISNLEFPAYVEMSSFFAWECCCHINRFEMANGKNKTSLIANLLAFVLNFEFDQIQTHKLSGNLAQLSAFFSLLRKEAFIRHHTKKSQKDTQSQD